MAIWGVLTVPYVKWYHQRERDAWENDVVIDAEKKLAEIESPPPSEGDNNHVNRATTASTIQSEPHEGAVPMSDLTKAPVEAPHNETPEIQPDIRSDDKPAAPAEEDTSTVEKPAAKG